MPYDVVCHVWYGKVHQFINFDIQIEDAKGNPCLCVDRIRLCVEVEENDDSNSSDSLEKAWDLEEITLSPEQQSFDAAQGYGVSARLK